MKKEACFDTGKTHQVLSVKDMNAKLVGIPETLLIALWARAAVTEESDAMIRDEKAVEMVSRIDYDFTRFESSNRFTKLGVAVRTMLLDHALSALLHKYPDAVVINFGAGLDTRHARMKCDNVDWYEIDVPESIELRRRFFIESDRYHFIAQSMFDLSWIEKVDISGKPVLFLAEGLFMYFPEETLNPFFRELAERFPGSEMLFEMLAPFMVGKSRYHETVKKIDGRAEFKWGLKNSRDMETWHPAVRFVEEWNYYDYHKKRWGLFGMIARLPFIRSRMACRIVHLCFT
ncbi:MAG: class I SAM-dependent methyltransferase [Sedimentisphaerales bacterium]|nr:class I SAM-dependent methyltransferase [Sedimentisphaerales bacterium]